MNCLDQVGCKIRKTGLRKCKRLSLKAPKQVYYCDNWPNYRPILSIYHSYTQTHLTVTKLNQNLDTKIERGSFEQATKYVNINWYCVTHVPNNVFQSQLTKINLFYQRMRFWMAWRLDRAKRNHIIITFAYFSRFVHLGQSAKIGVLINHLELAFYVIPANVFLNLSTLEKSGVEKE